MIYHVVKLIEYHQHRELDLNPVNIKMLIKALDVRLFTSLIELMIADIKSSKPPHDFSVTDELSRIYNEIVEHNHPVLIKDLAVDGNDIARLGFKRKEIGDQLNNLLKHVLLHPSDNKRTKLLSLMQNKA